VVWPCAARLCGPTCLRTPIFSAATDQAGALVCGESLTEGETHAAPPKPMRSAFWTHRQEARKPVRAMWASIAIANFVPAARNFCAGIAAARNRLRRAYQQAAVRNVEASMKPPRRYHPEIYR